MLKVTTSLWKHQQTAHDLAIPTLLSRGYFWFLAGCATGKTLLSYKTMETLKVKKVLVVTTIAAMRSAWERDAKQHTQGLPVYVLDKGTSKQKAAQLNQGDGVYVMNYDSAKMIKDTIAAAGFEMVVADESHKIKSYSSNVSLDLAAACKSIPYKINLTGTGWDDRPTDVFGQVRFFDPILKARPAYHQAAIFGHLAKYDDFFNFYVKWYSPRQGVKIPTGYKNLELLNEAINPFTIRIDSETVLDLPEAQHIDYNVPMPAEYLRIYRELRDEFLVRINNDEVEADNELVEQLRLQQITGGFYVNTNKELKHLDLKSPKISAVMDILQQINREPVVIFVKFNEDVKMLHDAIKAEYSDRRIMYLTGAQHDEYEWQYECTGDEILIVNVGAGSEGVNLSRSRYAILYSLGYSATSYTQLLWRVRRPGSDLTKPVVYFHVIMHRSMDDVIRSALNSKRTVLQEMMERVKEIA